MNNPSLYYNYKLVSNLIFSLTTIYNHRCIKQHNNQLYEKIIHNKYEVKGNNQRCNCQEISE